MTTSAPHRVAVLALSPSVGYDLAIPPQIFRTATDGAGRALYEVTVCGLNGDPVVTGAGYSILPGAGPEPLATADTVIVPGTQLAGPRHEGQLPPEVQRAWELIRPGTRIISICTGAFVLGAAGVLDDRPVTTHWKFAADLARLYPRARVDPEVLFVDDGDVLTSAGLGAGVDLCLHVVRRDHGSAVANAVARYCVVSPWRDGGQAQFIPRQVPTDNASTASTRAWAVEHLDAVGRVADLVRRAGMSERTFNRRFRDETGMSAHAWLLQQRLRRAQELLETTTLPVDQVAYRAGFGTPAAMRQHLRSSLGLTPLGYRRRFRGEPVAR
jgi:transcriptional regulator GlxA family with amidase domain